jgi:sulfite exporter TauE/SafE
METGYLAAFLTGLFGGVHCIGMCGGIVGAISLGLPKHAHGRITQAWPFLLAYNSGRISSYAMAGALMGGVGWLAANMAAMHQAQLILQLIAGAFMLSLGLYLGGWWQGLTRLEKAGGRVWKRIEPLGKRLLPVTTTAQAFRLGLVWGWLPCGLVYTMLIWSISAGGPLNGALLMLSFGIGTLPVLMAMGAFATQLNQWIHHVWVRRAAGGLVILFGLHTLWLAVDGFV